MATTKRVTVKPNSPTKQIIHEAGAKAKHRLVIVGDGIHDASPWFEFYEVGNHRGYHFSTGNVQGIPPGVFKIVEVNAQVLG